MKKKFIVSLMLIGLMLLTVMMMGSECEASEELLNTETEETTESALNYHSDLSETEKQEIYTSLAAMPASEFNETVGKAMKNLTDSEKQEFLAWLKANYLICDSSTIDNWQLPTEFQSPCSLAWPDEIPQPAQGTVSQTEQSEDVTRIQIKNITKSTYEAWETALDKQWSFGCAVLEAASEKFEKADEYIDNNTKYNFGDQAKSTEELYAQEGRTQSESTIVTDDHMSNWIEVTYGQNMATIAWNGDFSGNGAGQQQEKTDEQKIMEACIEKFSFVAFPAPSAGQLTKYTPEGKTKDGNPAQVLLFEGGTSQTTDEWKERFVNDGWKMNLYETEEDNYLETEMYDIDGTKDFYPEVEGFTYKERNVYFEKATDDNKVQRILMTTIETSYGLGDEVDRDSPKYKQWVIITVNEIDILDLSQP